MGVHRFAVATALATFLLLVAGGLVSTTESGLACGYDFPLCQGHIWPPGMHWGVQLHMLHRMGGVLVGIAVVLLSLWIWRHPVQVRGLRFLSAAAAVMVLIQINLGAAIIFTSRELVTMTFHSSLGAALLATLVSLYWVSNPSRVNSTLSLQSHRAAAGSLEPA